MASKPIIFQSPEVAKLLRANRFTLNRLMLRCDIETSYGRRGVRGSRLLFTVEDVATVAIGYWLFRGGLRTPAIKGALANKQVEELRKELVSPEDIEQAGERIQFLVSWRVAKGRVASQETKLEKDIAGVQRILESVPQYGFMVIPIGRLLKELAERIRNSNSGS